MNRTLCIAAAMGLFCLAAASASADERRDARLESIWAAILERVDTNKNSSLEVEELTKQLESLAAQIDADKNGSVSREELQAAARGARREAKKVVQTAVSESRDKNKAVKIADVEQHVHQALTRVDADKNGEITRGEARQAVRFVMAQAHKRAEAHCKAGRTEVAKVLGQAKKSDQVVLTAVIQRLDTNNDKKLQGAELQARAQAVFVAIDTDKDQALSKEEINHAAARAAQKVRRELEKRVAMLLK
ncbi:MAG: hypothetical protein K1X71_07855 [Pirellulales bacterium]|nr:hypothetical protein [Pirellulales bacterium]